MSATLAELEQRVAALEAGSGEYASNNLLTLDEAGNVGAEFTGHVKALGLDLDAADSVNTSFQARDVRWLSGAGAMIAELIAAGSATPPANGQRVLSARVISQALTETSTADLSAMGPAENVGDPTTVARVVAIDAPGLASAKRRVQADVTIDAGGALVRRFILAQSDGASDFLQLIATARRVVNFGSSTVTWPGASAISNVLTVNHGLGVAPQVVIVSSAGGGGLTYQQMPAAFNYTPTTFDVAGYTMDLQQPAAGAQGFVRWIAIG